VSEIESWIKTLGSVGTTGAGGVYRGSYMPAEVKAHEIVADWMREAGLRVWHDAAGNLWGRADGARDGARPIVAGSHLDTVRNGGNYDGIYGTLGAVMAVRELLRRHGPPTLPLEVVAFTGEEGSRFPLGLMGSRALNGTLKRQALDETKDDKGITIAQAMSEIGLDPDRINEAQRPDIAAFFELHIEQGPILEAAGIPIGVVQTIVGIQQVRVTVHGRADHAGTTPMNMRRDALVGAARMIGRIPDLAARTDGGVMTVGSISALPGSANVVPETVEFSIDTRHHEESVKLQMIAWAKETCEEVAAAANVDLTWKPSLPGSKPARLADEMQELVRQSCRELDLAYLDMHSRAGHDSKNLVDICPTGMIFIPSQGGRSHTPDEYSEPAAMERGVEVLAGCLHKLAYQERLARAS
jgi:allantoate deiminase